MVVFLSSFVPHLQLSVTEKLDFPDFINFSKCSHRSQLISAHIKGRISWVLEKIYVNDNVELFSKKQDMKKPVLPILETFSVKIVAEEIFLKKPSDQGCVQAIELIEKGQIATKRIKIGNFLSHKYFVLSSDNFNSLLKVAQIEDLSVDHYDTDDTNLMECLQVPEVFNVSGLFFSYKAPHDVIINGRANWITVDNADFTTNELNLILKQWYNGLRELDWINFVFYGTTQKKQLEKDAKIFSGIPHELIWSEDFHRDSIISERPIEDVKYLSRSMEGYRFYAVKQKVTRDEELLIRIEENRFEVDLEEDAKKKFLSIVNYIPAKLAK